MYPLDTGEVSPLDAIVGEVRKPCHAARRIMNNEVVGGLLDVRGIDLGDLESSIGESALHVALRRLLASSSGCNFNSFGSSI